MHMYLYMCQQQQKLKKLVAYNRTPLKCPDRSLTVFQGGSTLLWLPM